MVSLKELAVAIGADVRGDLNHEVNSCATLESARSDQLSFIYNKKYCSDLNSTNAGVVILSEKFLEHYSGNALIVGNPYLSYAKAASILHQTAKAEGSIHSSVVIGRDVNIADDCVIAPNVVIGDNVTIGAGCYIGAGSVIANKVVIGCNLKLIANVTICEGTKIGDDVIIHPSSVIGCDGFGYAPYDNKKGWCKIPQLGHVVLGNDVEIGSNTTIDCGALDNTIIGNGVKIDNQVQIAHNVEIGDHTAIAACTGIAGSTKIGRYCTLAGGVGLVGHIEIVDGVHVTGMTMVTHSIKEPGAYSSGTPFQKNAEWLKNAVRFKQLDKLSKKINLLLKSEKEA
ncbi:MAG: UDP-3-O-(3-hydroxymyristoyl)glucosamine N-acyltransferase [Cycloclasticus sp.]|jgi:UDP-3-O-[3-hydroxymyristoyl] glucosamine N-acyltransferase|nr:UDP-3-O-(3-hydroxymyristoyl)glucosamine N-acyltransferase [Cycloclasticus sp.]